MPATEQVYAELWISLASLLRSYTALHGLSSTRRATVVPDEERITVSCEAKRLELVREGAIVIWKREDDEGGKLELTETGRLKSSTAEEELDMAAEQWARDLMRESQ